MRSEDFCRGPSDVNIRSDIRSQTRACATRKGVRYAKEGAVTQAAKRLIKFWLMTRTFGHMKNHESSKFFLSDCLSVFSFSFSLALFYDDVA